MTQLASQTTALMICSAHCQIQCHHHPFQNAKTHNVREAYLVAQVLGWRTAQRWHLPPRSTHEPVPPWLRHDHPGRNAADGLTGGLLAPLLCPADGATLALALEDPVAANESCQMKGAGNAQGEGKGETYLEIIQLTFLSLHTHTPYQIQLLICNARIP